MMVLHNPWVAAALALFLWWFSTGALLWLVRRADNRGGAEHRKSVLVTLPLIALGVFGTVHSLDDISPQGTYVAFLSALALWGWIELAFLSGVITGPNTTYCPPNTRLANRFWRGFRTLAWHEALLLSTLIGLAFTAQGATNPFAFWTFAVLFFARISAKLNLFLGVPRIHVEFLPKPLGHLPSHFKHAQMNALFPVSITLLSFAAYCWMERLWLTALPGEITGFALLTALTLLALLEHWFMVLPLPDQKLWRWMLPARPTFQPRDSRSAVRDRLQEDANGF